MLSPQNGVFGVLKRASSNSITRIEKPVSEGLVMIWTLFGGLSGAPPGAVMDFGRPSAFWSFGGGHIVVKLATSLILAAFLSLSAPGLSAFAQTSDQCVEAASLWLPSETTRETLVTRWEKKEMRFAISSRDKDSAVVKSIEAELKFISQKTEMKLVEVEQSSEADLPDLLVVVDPDITEDAALLKDLAQKFFQSKLNGRGRVEIRDDVWSASIKNISPRCTGLDFEVNAEKAIALAIVQQDETSTCVSIGLGQSFGLIGGKAYYVANGQKISEVIVGEALRGLYSEKIRPGMSRAQALEQLDGACRK